MPPALPPTTVVDPSTEVAAARAWAARLQGTAGEIDAVATALSAAGRDVGLRGPTGTALQRLVGDLVSRVRELAAACEAAATSVLRQAR